RDAGRHPNRAKYDEVREGANWLQNSRPRDIAHRGANINNREGNPPSRPDFQTSLPYFILLFGWPMIDQLAGLSDLARVLPRTHGQRRSLPRAAHGAAVVLPLCPAIFNRDIAALDVTGLAQSLAERAYAVEVAGGRCAAENANNGHRWLLRARRERPRRRRAAEERDEIATLHHSITSSAVARSDGGTVSPNILAVCMLMTSSN